MIFNNKSVYALCLTFFVLAISFISGYFNFQIYSPDSIRFLHFWQNSFLLGTTDTSILNNIYDALIASNNYDLGRGRLVMYLLYGMENILLYCFTTIPQNFLLIFIICLNSHAVSLLVSRNIPDSRFCVYFLSFLIVAINAISLSPAMYFALYSKYICLTFILYFFVFERNFLKILMLLLAIFTDEVGLLLALLICFFYICQHLLNKYDSKSINLSILTKNIILSGFICLMLMALYFLIIFLAFDSTPIQFAKYSARGTLWLFDYENLIDRIIKLAWTIEVLILGFSFENRVFLALLGLSITIGLFMTIKTLFKKISLMLRDGVFWNNLYIIDFSTKQAVLIFWLLSSFILFIIMPAAPFAYQTYSYPLMLSLSLALLLSLSIYLETRALMKTLALISIAHILTISGSFKNINESNEKHFLKDGVSIKNISNLQSSINAIRTKQDYELFHEINNMQEIDFTGMWYFSPKNHLRSHLELDDLGNCIEKKNAFGNCLKEDYYYPIYGTVRVASWPYFDPQKAGAHERRFDKDKPTYRN